MPYDIRIWEEIRYQVSWRRRSLVESIGKEIASDFSLREFQGTTPIPWQLNEIMHQRAESWVQRLYDCCCEAYKERGKVPSPAFDAAMWAFEIEPFMMKEHENHFGYKASMLLELLLCAVGSSAEKRNGLKVSQKNCCLDVRKRVLKNWHQTLLRLPNKMEQSSAIMAPHAEGITVGEPTHHPVNNPDVQGGSPVAGVVQATTPSNAASSRFRQEPSTSNISPSSELLERRYHKFPRFSPRVDSAAAGMGNSTAVDSSANGILGIGETEQPPGVHHSHDAPSTVENVARMAAPPKAGAEASSEGTKYCMDTQHGEPATPGTGSRATEDKWKEIEISFLSDERVQIRNGKKLQTLNYAEFGFDDARTGNPNTAWQMLRRMAELGGTLENGRQARVEWPKLEKRIQEIRYTLRKHFGITSNPIPFIEKSPPVTNSGYRTRFKLSCAPSYRS
jgi:hypothetical protein